ncbi:Transketolase [Gracilaria domingensis]|nr:Transketolase [Gracilaria domingensis]
MIRSTHEGEDSRLQQASPCNTSHVSLESVSPLYASVRGSPSFSSDEELISYKSTLSNYSTSEQLALANLCVNSIRFLCVDAINNANSGHPGVCMGMASAAFVLFDNHMKFNPSNPRWLNRDRFVLSAGHGSMLLYSLLYFCGYDSVSFEDIKQFRALNSTTPGHPECTETAGVEVCTGPLGQGISNAVGIAIAEAHVASVFNRPGFPVVDNYTFCIAGDGCLMEGISSEACSLAGHLRLGKLIVLYDDNHISIDGSTDLAFTEDVRQRFEAYGWQVLHVKEGSTDLVSIDRAILEAKKCTDKPTLIKVTTVIGYGAPNKQNTAKIHGAALGADETSAARRSLKYEYEPFDIPAPALEHLRRKVDAGASQESSWKAIVDEYKAAYPKLHTQFVEQMGNPPGLSTTVTATLRKTALSLRNKSQATRKHSKVVLNAIAPLVPNMIGGSADTSPSTLTDLDCSTDFTFNCRRGRNIRFGVREHAMGAISNGMGLAGYNLYPFCSTFFVFTDYMRAAMRMASLSETGTVFIMTHDSVGLGEDGPSHQPIEHLASFRAMPNHNVWRPADGVETAAAYANALASRKRPSTIVLSRQPTNAMTETDFDNAQKGGYVVYDTATKETDGVLIATGTEVSIAVSAAKKLEQDGFGVRVVSLPCWEVFAEQGRRYRKGIINVGRECCIAVEAGSRFGWERYADWFVSVDEFGKSGKGSEVMKEMGICEDSIVERFMQMIANSEG